MSKFLNLASKTLTTIRQDGMGKVYEKSKLYLKRKREMQLEGEYTKGCFRDVLFINGCDEHLPHPGRYRVTHQREQLESLGFSTGEVYYQNVEKDILRFYRIILFFRCPYTDQIGELVELAKKLNKTLLYDIDDLVFDTVYTDQIPYLKTMNPTDRQQYDENVRNMGKLLQLCDGAITTTARLAGELEKYVPKVLINRNVASEEMVQLSLAALKKRNGNDREKDDPGVKNHGKAEDKAKTASGREQTEEKIRIGYFSGSITHNDDFAMVIPVLIRLLGKYKNLELCLAGELDLPEELKPFETQIQKYPFSDWRGLPDLLAQTDINIAPLISSVFNEAKSENKWMEAALVKVPTVASNLGAFREMVRNGENGLLCSCGSEWEAALKKLICDRNYREKLGQNAFVYGTRFCTTAVTGKGLVDFLKEMETPDLMFLLPGFQVSGGVMVALQHARILQDAGRDVTLLSIDENGKEEWYEFEDHRFPVLNVNTCKIKGKMDWCVATMWSTCSWFARLGQIRKKGYLVQNYEPDFYEPGNPLRMQARSTYGEHPDWKYLTISKWCEHWLTEQYGHKTGFAPNGLDVKKFARLSEREDIRIRVSGKKDGDARVKESGKTGQKPGGNQAEKLRRKIRILIEGDSSAPHKNVDESFYIVEKLDREKFEIWYMAYHGTPKDWYRVDRFLPEVPYEKVQEIYQQCDILLKSSILESFSYPPLEMMASGGTVVVVQNDGNKEYLKEEENCLLYPLGDLEAAQNAILRICDDRDLREKLIENGLETARKRDWENIREEILNLYAL